MTIDDFKGKAHDPFEIVPYEKWMLKIIAKGLQPFILLSLPNQPPADMIKHTPKAWCEALMEVSKEWDEALDTPRFIKAFSKLKPVVKHWPTPEQFLAVLPPRPKPKALPPRRPADLTPEERQMNLKWISQLKTQLKDIETKRQMPKPKPEDYEDKRWPYK